MSIIKAGCLAVALTFLGIPAHPQNASADDLVRVNISDHEMLNSLARALNVEVARIPLLVQVPVRVAARVCGMRPRDLAADESGEPANCDALSASPAFQRAVRRQLLEE
jgi:hypothetical protein